MRMLLLTRTSFETSQKRVIKSLKTSSVEVLLVKSNSSTSDLILKTLEIWENYIFSLNKRLLNVPGGPVISNCGTPTEKVSEFLDNHLQTIMKKGLSYIRNSGDFIDKICRMGSIPDNAILVTADVMALYPRISHDAGLKALREVLNKREQKKVPAEELVKMADFVLKNNFIEFNG